METYFSIENTNLLNNTILEENLKQAEFIIKQVQDIKQKCFLGLELMIQELCKKHNLSFSSGMGSTSFDFKIIDINVWLYDDGIFYRKESQKSHYENFKTKEQLEKLISIIENDLKTSKIYNSKEDSEYFQNLLLILNKVNSFYPEFEFLMNETKKVAKMFKFTSVLENIKDFKN